MKIKELREKSIVEWLQTKELYKEELIQLRMQSTTKQIEKPSRLRDLRRGIAQLETLLREEEIKDPTGYATAIASAVPRKAAKETKSTGDKEGKAKKEKSKWLR